MYKEAAVTCWNSGTQWGSIHGLTYLSKSYGLQEESHSSTYRIALKLGGSENSRIAVFERFVEMISRIRC